MVPKEKGLTSDKDVTAILRALFTVEHMATLQTTRHILYTALFFNLAVDCSGRVGELLLGSGKKAREGNLLRWKHVEFYAFPITGGLTNKAKLRFLPFGRNKAIPLRLLSLRLAAEDSLRLLTKLAMIDGVLKDLRCWDDISFLTPGPDGTRLQ